MDRDDPHGERKAATVSDASDVTNAADLSAGSAVSAVSEPETDTEKALGEIWCEVLAVPEAGPEDNFFGLGGTSLHAMQAVARARRALACPQLKLADVFRAATLRELAERVDTLSAAGRT